MPESNFLSCLDSGQDIGAVSAGRDANEYIVGLDDASQFSGKDLFKAIVVANRTDRGIVLSQRQLRQARAVELEPGDKFRRQVLCIGKTATFAREDNLADCTQGGCTWRPVPRSGRGAFHHSAVPALPRWMSPLQHKCF